jgi:hypothetical protein
MQYSPPIAAQSFSACSQGVSALQAMHMAESWPLTLLPEPSLIPGPPVYRVQNQCHHERIHGWRPVTANAT